AVVARELPRKVDNAHAVAVNDGLGRPVGGQRRLENAGFDDARALSERSVRLLVGRLVERVHPARLEPRTVDLNLDLDRHGHTVYEDAREAAWRAHRVASDRIGIRRNPRLARFIGENSTAPEPRCPVRRIQCVVVGGTLTGHPEPPAAVLGGWARLD